VEKRRFCVYAIQSEITGRVYLGQSDCVQRKLMEHNEGRVKSTRHERPWKIMATEFFKNRDQARWLESGLKRSRGKRLEWLDKNRL